MFSCFGLFLGFAFGFILGGPWMFIAPTIGFVMGFVGDMKLMHSSHRNYRDFGWSCCGSTYMHDKNDEKDARDPVCGMEVDEKTAKYKIEFNGKIYYFCSSMCQSEFKKNPKKYVK